MVPTDAELLDIDLDFFTVGVNTPVAETTGR